MQQIVAAVAGDRVGIRVAVQVVVAGAADERGRLRARGTARCHGQARAGSAAVLVGHRVAEGVGVVDREPVDVQRAQHEALRAVARRLPRQAEVGEVRRGVDAQRVLGTVGDRGGRCEGAAAHRDAGGIVGIPMSVRRVLVGVELRNADQRMVRGLEQVDDEFFTAADRSRAGGADADAVLRSADEHRLVRGRVRQCR